MEHVTSCLPIRQPPMLDWSFLHQAGMPHTKRPLPDRLRAEAITASECRGDIINSSEPNKAARLPNPQRLVKAYNQSAATLNLLRGFATGGLRPGSRHVLLAACAVRPRWGC